jgi:enoyl-CoA hydratase/carnithine racemase
VTFDHPAINAITATTVAELTELVGLIEEDADLNVVVFDSANPDFYLAPGVDPTGMPAWIDLLVRLSGAPVVSIAAIRGRVRGAGSEFVLTCDLRFAARENTLLGQFDGPRAEQYGYVNRVVADDRLDDEVEAIASRLARFDHDLIARAKSRVPRHVVDALPDG